MNLNEYQHMVTRTMVKQTSFDQKVNVTSNYCMGLAGESGETIDMIKKFLHHGHDIDIVELTKELGDVLWYLTAIAEQFDISMVDVAEMNIAKLSKRYPEGFDKEMSVNRTE